jgi:hypothetical protein
MKGWEAAKNVIAKHGKDAVKSASVRGKALDVPKPAVAAGGGGTSVFAKKKMGEDIEDVAAQIMEECAPAPRTKPSNIKQLMSDQLRFSGYTDEHINKVGGR